MPILWEMAYLLTLQAIWMRFFFLLSHFNNALYSSNVTIFDSTWDRVVSWRVGSFFAVLGILQWYRCGWCHEIKHDHQPQIPRFSHLWHPPGDDTAQSRVTAEFLLPLPCDTPSSPGCQDSERHSLTPWCLSEKGVENEKQTYGRY